MLTVKVKNISFELEKKLLDKNENFLITKISKYPNFIEENDLNFPDNNPLIFSKFIIPELNGILDEDLIEENIYEIFEKVVIYNYEDLIKVKQLLIEVENELKFFGYPFSKEESKDHMTNNNFSDSESKDFQIDNNFSELKSKDFEICNKLENDMSEKSNNESNILESLNYVENKKLKEQFKTKTFFEYLEDLKEFIKIIDEKINRVIKENEKLLNYNNKDIYDECEILKSYFIDLEYKVNDISPLVTYNTDKNYVSIITNEIICNLIKKKIFEDNEIYQDVQEIINNSINKYNYKDYRDLFDFSGEILLEKNFDKYKCREIMEYNNFLEITKK